MDGKGRRALVTGGAIRVGRALALALADAGFDVAIAYHRSAAAARATVGAIRARGRRAVAVRGDLRQAVTAGRVVRRAARVLGGLDVLVNSAALFYRTPLATASAADWDAMLALNVRAAFLCAQAAVPCLARGGHIVNVGDALVAGPPAGWSAYAVSKVGLATLTRALAAELAPRGIAVNCVAPGPVLKPDRLSAARWRRITAGFAAGPADVAAAVLFFATCPPRITGQVLDIQGGGR